MKIAVLGSGNGGCATAFDCAAAGHDVRLFDFEQFDTTIAAISQAGGLHSEGDLKGFAEMTYAGHDIERTLAGVDTIYAVGPAYSTRPFGQVCGPHLKQGQTVIICPGSCAGSIEFMRGAGLELGDQRVTVAETSTLPYAVRILEPGRIRVFLKLKGGLYLAALPAKDTSRVIEQIAGIYPCMTAAENIWQTTLQNANPVIHPAVTMLNTAQIERTAGAFHFYEDGVTPAVGRLVKAVDLDRIAIGRRIGVDVLPDPEIGMRQGYMAEATYDIGYSKAPGFKGITAQDSLDYRYFNEDVGYGLVFLESLGQQVGVPVKTITNLIDIISVIMERDYRGEAKRTMQTLGLDERSPEELCQLVA
jgi:opine dehydrogenase